MSSEIERRQSYKWRWRLLGIWIIVFTFLVFGILYINNKQNNDRIKDLKRNRDSIVYIGCIEQNSRYYNTIKALNREFALRVHQAESPEILENLNRTRDYTELLIKALVPVRDCPLLVKSRQNLEDVPN